MPTKNGEELKVMTVFGTRPEAIKLAPVIKELEKHPDRIQSVVVVTAQHREMLDQVLGLFGITPDYDLDIMRADQSLFDVVLRAIDGLKPVLEKERPDILLVQGDTTTTFAAALAAFYLKIPIGHVEAGLRTFDKHRPFPEEMNRRLTSSLADLHFAPTTRARENLLKEGVPREKVHVTGNTVIDALLAPPLAGLKEDYGFDDPVLKSVDFDSRKVILVTAHRRESWCTPTFRQAQGPRAKVEGSEVEGGKPLENICRAIRDLISGNEDVEVVFSVHLNPRVREVVGRILGDERRVHLLDPLDYEPFVQLMKRCYLILTDSGGIQEEAPSLGKPVLVMREVTERPEGLEAGTVKLVGTDAQRILEETNLLLKDSNEYNKMAKAVNPYGDGRASERIVEIILTHFGLQPRRVSNPRGMAREKS
ncbi:MAG: UDP-N-acetylglucosamine 2-epimerase (non-hydrolyzing) [Actinomycetota bacterium]|nr:UDP-N-acetylglucosamine 2-epimerase (non-hydrolyzing) [Actinomycetota bacterium]